MKTVAILNKEREQTLKELLSKYDVSIWDVYDESGIGRERSEIAREFVRGYSSVLDVATGRGYFAFACARSGCQVTAIDIMDGEERVGWWKVFLGSSSRLGLGRKVSAIRSDASSLPVKSRRFEVVSCIHAIRNFLEHDSLKGILAEMRRAAAKGGKVVVAESSTESESPAEEVYLACLRLRAAIGWEATLPNVAKLKGLLEEAGFSRITSTKKRFDRDYAPVEFPSYVISEQPPRIRREYDRIEMLRSKSGIKPTPVMVVSAIVDT
jgi:ubiquinone/menaquinone biosynthesis C-methylase UbiE